MIKFKQTNHNIESGHLLGYVNATFNRLVELFGEPLNGCMDDYKMSYQWVLESSTGQQVYIYNWKCTSNYDSDYPSPDEWRMCHSNSKYEWHVGGEHPALVNQLIDYINSDSTPIRVSRNDERDGIINQLIAIRNRVNPESDKVSPRYAPLDSVQLYTQSLRILREAGLTDVNTVVKSPKGRGTHHFIEIQLNQLKLGSDGGLIPRILISNSYQGESVARINVGLFRLVCANGLVMGDNYFSQKITHVVGRTFDEKVDGLQDGIAAAIDYLRNEVTRLVNNLRFTRLTEVQQLRLLFSLELSESITQNAVHLFQSQALGKVRAEDSSRNLWTFYNIVNEAIEAGTRSHYSRVRKNMALLSTVESEYSKLVA